MLVRLVEEHRFGVAALPPGALLAISDEEASQLIFDGVAIPVTRGQVETAGRETR